ncbi:transposase [Streptomyces tubercidicus]|uniref:transposase n=1 Tax=Streptomyces tubercidicus TaxID=47759 RepID=UPI003466361E
MTKGYRGPANEFPDQISAPPKKPEDVGDDDAPLTERYAWCEMRRRQSSRRICVEHANAEHKQWRLLQRFLGRREHYPATHRAVASLVSDRAAQRVTRGKPSTELMPVSTTAC